jgi:hypothetical protein
MAGVIYKLDRTGHGEVAKWGEDAESRAAGAAAFADLAAKGYTMFDITNPQEDAPILKAFDPEAREVIAVPQLVGG